MSLICSKCRKTFRFAGPCPSCSGAAGDCRVCYGTGRRFVCGCDGADALAEAAATAPPEERPIRPPPPARPAPREPTLDEIAARARERRGAPPRVVAFDHDFRDGRCTICGKLEMLAGRHGWRCA